MILMELLDKVMSIHNPRNEKMLSYRLHKLFVNVNFLQSVHTTFIMKKDDKTKTYQYCFFLLFQLLAGAKMANSNQSNGHATVKQPNGDDAKGSKACVIQ